MDKREVLRQKLRQKIKEKRINQPTLKEKNKIKKEFKKEYNELTNDPRITQEMLLDYTQALLKFPNINIGTPKMILDDQEKYKKEYSNYVLTIIEKAKENKWNINTIKSMMNNEYTKYLTKILNLPEIPSFLN